MTFATSAVVMSEIAAAEAAATAAAIAEAAAVEGATATAAAAAGSGIEAASLQQAAQAAMTQAAPAATMTGVAPAITGGIEGLGVGEAAATGVEQGIAQAMPTAAAPEVATAAPAATPLPTAAPQGIDFYQVPQGQGVQLSTLPQSAPSPYGIGPVNPAEFNIAPVGGPGISNSAMGMSGQATAPSALERGFDKVMKFASDNPWTTAYALGTTLNSALAPGDKEPEKKPSSLSKYKLSPNFQPSRPVPNVYQPQYQNYQTQKFAQGGIAALAQGGYPMGRQDNTQFATPTQMPMSAEVLRADYEPVEMAAGGVASPQYNYAPQSAFSQGSMNNPSLWMFGKGGGMGKEPVDPLAKFARAPNVAPNPYRPSYVPETRTPVGPPSNDAILNFNAKWGGAQNLLNTYAPNLTQGAASPMTQAAPAAAPAAPGFAKGGMPAPDIDTGIISEEDPDFAFTSPYKTAAGRLEKLYKKTHVPTKTMAIAPELGAVDLTPAMMKKAAQGGIMGADASLGSYAHGGNARLLRGPGDGMSDDIPATIANKQPARLADGEFVIPADVVSHLGNGSTEAGAKHLHGMMDKVRKARTGRKAQGKQINPKKFMPK